MANRKPLLCFLSLHDWERKPCTVMFDILHCRSCPKVKYDLTLKGRAAIKHYCPQCRELEEDCECAMC